MLNIFIGAEIQAKGMRMNFITEYPGVNMETTAMDSIDTKYNTIQSTYVT